MLVGLMVKSLVYVYIGHKFEPSHDMVAIIIISQTLFNSLVYDSHDPIMSSWHYPLEELTCNERDR